MPCTSLVFTSCPARIAARAVIWVARRMPCPPTPTITMLVVLLTAGSPGDGEGAVLADLLAEGAPAAQHLVHVDLFVHVFDGRASQLEAELAFSAQLLAHLAGGPGALLRVQGAGRARDDEPGLMFIRIQCAPQRVRRGFQV